MRPMPLDAARAIEFATAAGENALTAFGAALLVLLLIVGAGWFVVQRHYIRRHKLPDTAAARALTATLVLGFAAILMAALLLTTLPNWMVVDGWVALADKALTDAVRRNVSVPVLQMFAAVTLLANTSVLWMLAIGGAVVLLWRRDYLLACIWIAAIAGNGILTRMLKAVFARSRPLYEHDLFTVQGWSFPSGHASGAVVAYGMLAYVLIRSTPVIWRLPILLLATAIAFVTGCSRIFLQVHYASDVLAGFASGLAWLAVCIIAAASSRRVGGRPS
jgi:membrane-associated phospholipid phosphatase